MKENNRKCFKMGLRDGLPISLGYFAVSFTLGIAAQGAGLTAIQATFASLMINASAGEFVGFTLIASSAGYLEIAIMELIANARYLLMSCALSQKLPANTPLIQKLIIGFDVTDEIFGISIAVSGKLNPFYTIGAIVVSMPGWASGTFLGVILGNALPARIVSALSVGLFGMFIAVIIPPAKKQKIIAGIIVVSFLLSYIINTLKIFDFISSGVKIILLTVVISAVAAILFPVKEDSDNEA
ncbi:MAG: AzlC family ABC transporter permease [Clostridiales bacterium]|nr:AzlC family ABC transporter permease [Clostridiales bacterium]